MIKDVARTPCGVRYVFAPWEDELMGWVLIADLRTLMNEFNTLAPNRDHASDGTIGDAAHAQESSDHNPDETGKTPYEDSDNINEVHAIDVDNNLNKPGWSMQRALDIIIGRHQRGEDDRLQNVIYNRRIWSRSWGWTPRVYTGASPHTEHAHFSGRYGSGTTNNPEADTRPWGLLEVEADGMEPGDVWNKVAWGKTNRETAGDKLVYVDATVEALETRVEDIEAKVDQILAAVTKNAVPN